MQSWKPKSKSIEMWLVATAIGKQHNLIDKMQKNEDGSYPIQFTIGGVELDFYQVGKRIQEEIDRITKERAEQMLDERCSDVCEKLEDMQERIKELKERYFKYDWE